MERRSRVALAALGGTVAVALLLRRLRRAAADTGPAPAAAPPRPKPRVLPTSCHVCGASAASAAARCGCGGCGAFAYCGKAHQKAHWRGGHRVECDKLRLRARTEATRPARAPPDAKACPICASARTDAVASGCGHSACRACVELLRHRARRTGVDWCAVCDGADGGPRKLLEDAWRLEARATRLAREGKVDDARAAVSAMSKVVKQALRADASSGGARCAAARHAAGRVASLHDDDITAAVHYRKALAIDSKHVDALVDLGGALDRMGRAEEAVECYRKAAAAGKDDGMVAFQKAQAFAEANQLYEAEAAFREAVKVEGPMTAAAHGYLGNLLLARGAFAQACDSYYSMLHIEPANSGAFTQLGVALTALEELDAACVALRRAVSLDALNAVARIALGRALGLTHGAPALAAAIEHLQKAKALDHSNVDASFFLAVSFAQKGDRAAAIDEARRCILLNGANAAKARQLLAQLR